MLYEFGVFPSNVTDFTRTHFLSTSRNSAPTLRRYTLELAIKDRRADKEDDVKEHFYESVAVILSAARGVDFLINNKVSSC